jgi:pSer/pThr/pTyr-binding forkhead associated (FHA) protein
MNCIHCGSPIEPGKKFCGECGQPVAVEPPPTEAPPPIPDDIATELVPMPIPEEQWVLVRPGQDPIILGDSLLFGRGTDCDYVLDDSQASRKHALIEKGEEGYTLTDQDSSNGTFVNEERLYGPVLLSEGDTIRIGQTTFTFELEGEQEPVKPAVKVDQPKPVPAMEEVKAAEPAPPVEPADQSFCPECGASIDPGTTFCGACGHQLASAPAAPQAWDSVDSLEPQPINPRRLHFSRRGLLIGGGIILALLISAACCAVTLSFAVQLLESL